jgi:hypothetical protein
MVRQRLIAEKQGRRAFCAAVFIHGFSQLSEAKQRTTRYAGAR